MRPYYYHALNEHHQPISGSVNADSLPDALATIAAQGLELISIGLVPIALEPASREPENFANEAVDRTALEERLTSVMDRLRALCPILKPYAKELPAGKSRQQLEEAVRIIEDANAGAAADAFFRRPKFWIPLLAAASVSRDPSYMVNDFLDDRERTARIQREWWASLTYPAMLAAVGVAVVTLLSVWVIPVFAELIAGFNLRAPLLTRIVLGVGEWIASGRIFVVMAVVCFVFFALWRLSRYFPKNVQEKWAEGIARMRGQRTSLARLCYFTADLLEAEFPVPIALRLAGVATGAPLMQRAAHNVAARLNEGHANTASSGRIPIHATVLYVFQAELTNGTRIRLLREIGTSYSEYTRCGTLRSRGFIEPLTICVLGLFVAIVMFALFQPMLELLGALS